MFYIPGFIELREVSNWRAGADALNVLRMIYY